MSKATKLIVRARVEEILAIMLDGAEPWDIRQYVSEKQAAGEVPWKIPRKGKPLSERQIRRYCDRAEEIIVKSQEADREKLIRRHLARRRNLYAKAVSAGDYRTALSCAIDEAELTGLYPAKEAKHKVGGDPDNPTPIPHAGTITIDDTVARFAASAEAVLSRRSAGLPSRNGHGERLDSANGQNGTHS